MKYRANHAYDINRRETTQVSNFPYTRIADNKHDWYSGIKYWGDDGTISAITSAAYSAVYTKIEGSDDFLFHWDYMGGNARWMAMWHQIYASSISDWSRRVLNYTVTNGVAKLYFNMPSVNEVIVDVPEDDIEYLFLRRVSGIVENGYRHTNGTMVVVNSTASVFDQDIYLGFSLNYISGFSHLTGITIQKSGQPARLTTKEDWMGEYEFDSVGDIVMNGYGGWHHSITTRPYLHIPADLDEHGRIESTGKSGRRVMVGFNVTENNWSYGDLDYATYYNTYSSRLKMDIYELGAHKGLYDSSVDVYTHTRFVETFRDGDTKKVRYGIIDGSGNDVILYVSATPVTTILYFALSFYNKGVSPAIGDITLMSTSEFGDHIVLDPVEHKFGFRRLDPTYSNHIVKLRRELDDDISYFSLVNDYLDTASIISWLAGSTARVEEFHSQSSSRIYIQTDPLLQPLLDLTDTNDVKLYFDTLDGCMTTGDFTTHNMTFSLVAEILTGVVIFGTAVTNPYRLEVYVYNASQYVLGLNSTYSIKTVTGSPRDKVLISYDNYEGTDTLGVSNTSLHGTSADIPLTRTIPIGKATDGTGTGYVWEVYATEVNYPEDNILTIRDDMKTFHNI